MAYEMFSCNINSPVNLNQTLVTIEIHIYIYALRVAIEMKSTKVQTLGEGRTIQHLQTLDKNDYPLDTPL